MFFDTVTRMLKFFSLAIAFFCFACGNNKAETAAAPPPPKYYFYPQANVYFDTVNQDYLFLTNEGKTWTSARQIPDVVQSMMDKSVLIDSPAAPVWKDNANHKLVYSALLYASPNDTVERKEPVVVVKKPVNSDSVKKKKGLGKFLDKIFGRKKKAKQEDEKKNQ